eukprot:Skav213340  [mRNA]  locus=scaffold3340:451135:454262:+ [translate_table: standard]
MTTSARAPTQVAATLESSDDESDSETAPEAASSSWNVLGPSPYHQVRAVYPPLPVVEGPPPGKTFPGPPLDDGVYSTNLAGTYQRAPKAEASQLPEPTALRWKRVTRPKARAKVTSLVQAEQKRKQMTVTPPCLWCGLPTGCYCDSCRRSVCTKCDNALHFCPMCFVQTMRCTEGKAREHAALLLKDVPETGHEFPSLTGNSVCPSFRQLPFEEQAPGWEIRQCLRAQVSAAKEDEERRLQVAEEKAQEERRLAAQIAQQNSAAQAHRSSRRHGAGAAGQRPPENSQAAKVLCENVDEAEPSKAQLRRERQRLARAASAKRKAAEKKEVLEEQFRRETAAAFAERNQTLEVVEPKPKAKPKGKPREVSLSDDKLATDLQVALWAAKVSKS